jgi:hypothetical protein
MIDHCCSSSSVARRHVVVFSVDLRKESQWAADMKLCGDERDPPVVLLNRLKLKQKPPKR